MNEKIDQKIADALSPLVAEPSADLVRRLRMKSRESVPRPLWQRARFSIPVLTGSALVATVVVGTLLPAKASAKSFALIQAAAGRIDAFQFTILSVEDGERDTFTIAGAGGRTVMRADDHTLIEFKDGAMSVYDPDEKSVTRIKFGSPKETAGIANMMQSGLAEAMKEMDLKKTLRDYADKYGNAGIRISPVATENGHGVYHVSLTSTNEPERVEMTVDASTDLPERMEVRDRDGHSSMTMEMRYGRGVDERLLRSSIPAGAKVEEIDLGELTKDALKGLESLGADSKHEKP